MQSQCPDGRRSAAALSVVNVNVPHLQRRRCSLALVQYYTM